MNLVYKMEENFSEVGEKYKFICVLKGPVITTSFFQKKLDPDFL